MENCTTYVSAVKIRDVAGTPSRHWGAVCQNMSEEKKNYYDLKPFMFLIAVVAALCSRNFQNVKLRLQGMEILHFACH